MVLDSTKWASTSDGDLATQPVVNAAPTNDVTNHKYTITFSSSDGGVMVTDSLEEFAEYLWENASNEFHPVKGDGKAISVSIATSDTVVNQSSYFRSIYNSPSASYAVGLTHNISIYYDADGSGSFTLSIYTPYFWPAVDLAELIFAWTRFYTDGGVTARDELDEASLEAYSTRMQNHLFRVELWVWRESRKSMASLLAELIEEAGVLASFGGQASGGERHSHFMLRHILDAPDIGDIYDLDTDFPSGARLLNNDRQLVNLIRCTWGSFAEILSGPTMNWSTPGAPPGDGNVLTIDLNGAITRPANVTKRHCMRAENADAAIQPWLYDTRKRVIEFTMGPLHFDFDVGSIVHVSSTSLGFDGTEDLLVIRKEINWDTLFSVVRAVEIDRFARAMNPDDSSVSASLIHWYQPSGILTSGSSVTGWTDDGSDGDDLSAMTRGAAGAPTKQTAYINGHDVVDFGSGLTGLDFSPSSQPWDYTVIAVVKNEGSTSPQYLIDGAGSPYDRAIGVDYQSSPNKQWWMATDSTIHDGANEVGQGWRIVCWRLRDSIGHTGTDPEVVAKSSIHVHTDGNTEAQMTQEVAFDWDGGLLSSGDNAVGCNHEGTSKSWNGKVAEILVYNRVLRPHQIRRVIAGLKAKYAL